MSLFRALFERRSFTSPDIYQLLTRGHVSVSGQTVSEANAMRVAAVYSCVSLIAGTLATLPLHVYQRAGDGERRRRDDHPVAIVFRKPNRWQTRVDFLQMLQTSILLRGNAYALIRWDGPSGTTPRELWPLHPDMVEVQRGRDLSLRYLVRMDPADPPMTVSQQDILHVRGLSTNGWMGRSVLSDARDVIGIAQATQEHAGTFWSHGGGPDLIAKHPKSLSDKAIDSLERRLSEAYGGRDGQRRIAVLEEGMEMQPISMTKEDAQFLDTRKFQRGEIAGLFQVPPHMIGDTEKSTSWGTGIEQQQIGFLQYTLRRWLVTWEQAIWAQLIEAEGSYYAEFNAEGLLRGDLKTRMESYEIGTRIGLLSIDEARAKENMAPVPGGDVHWRQLNLAPLTQVDPPADAAPAGEGAQA